jgi:hypothetical protein
VEGAVLSTTLCTGSLHCRAAGMIVCSHKGHVCTALSGRQSSTLEEVDAFGIVERNGTCLSIT